MSLLQKLLHRNSPGFGAYTTADEVLQSINLSNKVVFITGVTSGLGAESAKALRSCGAYVIGLSRTTAKNVDLSIACDLSEPQQIRQAINKIIQHGRKIDVILCNAGVMALPSLQKIMGYEKQFFVNHLSHFILVTELLDYLNEHARVVVVASEGYRLAKNHAIEFDNLNGGCNYRPWRAYGQSKLANILFMQALAEQWKETNKIAIAVHPGMITTNLNRYLPIWQRLLLLPIELFATKSIPCGAATQVFASAHPNAATMNGCYLANCDIRSIDKNLEQAKQLWRISMDIKEKLFF